MTTAEMTKLAIALGACFAAYKWGGSAIIKSAGVAVGAVIVAKRIPYVSDAL